MIEAVEKKLPEEVIETPEEMKNKDIETIVNALLSKKDFGNLLLDILKNDERVIKYLDNIAYEQEKQKDIQKLLSLEYPGYFKTMKLGEYLNVLTEGKGLCGAVLRALYQYNDNHLLCGEPIYLEKLYELIITGLYRNCDVSSVKDALVVLHKYNIIQYVSNEHANDYYISFNFPQLLIPLHLIEKPWTLQKIIDWENILSNCSEEIKEFHRFYCRRFNSYRLTFYSPSNAAYPKLRTRLHVSFFFIEFLLENGCTPSAALLASYLNVSDISDLEDILDLCGEWITIKSRNTLANILTTEKCHECGLFVFGMTKFEDFLFSIRPTMCELQRGEKSWSWRSLVDALPTTSMVMERRWVVDTIYDTGRKKEKKQ